MNTQPEPINANVAPGCVLFTPRQITDHKLNGLNERITVAALDAPGPAGTCHHYSLWGTKDDSTPPFSYAEISFQKGVIAENGYNGLTNEAVLSVLIDRMRGFQYGRKTDNSFDESIRGEFSCRENAVALTHLEEALMWLQKRTRDRLARGVEGTHKV